MSTFKKAWLLLNYKQKKYAIFMLILMFLAMILESLSIAIIFPLISILLKGDIDTSFFSYFFVFGKLTVKHLVYFGLSITLLLSVFMSVLH
mgnify:CR=1 FL=1